MMTPPTETITDEQRKLAYLRRNGVGCLFCIDDDVKGRGFDSDGAWVEYHQECENCGATWSEIHALSDVTNIEPPKEFVGWRSDPVEDRWQEIDFGDDAHSWGEYDQDRFGRKTTTLTKLQFELLCGPLNELNLVARGWRVDHVVATKMTIETWTVWIGDVEVEHHRAGQEPGQVTLENRCIIVLGDRKRK